MVGLALNQKCVNVQNHMVELFAQIVCKSSKKTMVYIIALQSYAVIVTVQVVGHVQLVQLV